MPVGARTMSAGFNRFDLPDGRKDETLPEPCTTITPTPAEALKCRIKLPWEGKVQRMKPEDLTKELLASLEEYGLSRLEIMQLFRCYSNKFHAMLKTWGVPKGIPGGTNRAARAENLEKAETDPVIKCRPGHSLKDKKAEMAQHNKPIELRTYHDTVAGRAKAAVRRDAELEAEIGAALESRFISRVQSIIAESAEAEVTGEEKFKEEEFAHAPTPEEVDKFFAPDTAEAEHPRQMSAPPPESIVIQAARELGHYAGMGVELGILVQDKQNQYGDMISAMGPFLRSLYPNGIRPDQYDDLALIVRIGDKLGRITRGNGQGGETPYRDIAGYGLLGDSGQQYRGQTA